MYYTGNIFSTSSENLLLDEPLSINTNEVVSHVSNALSDASAYPVLLGEFNIYYKIWGRGQGMP
jgi:hypothetical protein